MAGTRDVEPPEDARIYLFASTQHGPGTVPLVDTDTNTGARGMHGFNAVDYAPLLRAVLVNLDRWVTDGTPPPPSVFPRLADGTAVPGPAVLAAYHGIPGVTRPDPELLPTIRHLDLGPEAAQGIGHFPAVAGEWYPNYVSAVDTDGNERGGLRMPDVTVPIATYTGWDPRHPDDGRRRTDHLDGGFDLPLRRHRRGATDYRRPAPLPRRTLPRPRRLPRPRPRRRRGTGVGALPACGGH